MSKVGAGRHNMTSTDHRQVIVIGGTDPADPQKATPKKIMFNPWMTSHRGKNPHTPREGRMPPATNVPGTRRFVEFAEIQLT